MWGVRLGSTCTLAATAAATAIPPHLACRHIPLMLPANVPPTTHGQLITCDYWVGVKLKGGMCVSDMRMKVPAVIQPPQPPPPAYSEPPPGWNPQQARQSIPFAHF